jgi:hypothetical protein
MFLGGVNMGAREEKALWDSHDETAKAQKILVVSSTGNSLNSTDTTTPALRVTRTKGGISLSGARIASTSISVSPADIYWMAWGNTSVAGTIAVSDCTSSTFGSTSFKIAVGINGTDCLNFDPPMEYGVGIYVTIAGSTGMNLNIAYK